MDTPPASHTDIQMDFLNSVLGACSITRTILQAYGYTASDPEERETDYRNDLNLIQHLCKTQKIPAERLSDLETLLDMLDQFAASNRRATVEQQTSARLLNRQYVAWCKTTFFAADT